jgi:hypothetical protein
MMNSKKVSTRQLLGIDKLNDDIVSTATGELIYYMVKPTNIGVLPANSITEKVLSLQELLQSREEIEMLATNAWQSFAHNKDYYLERISNEPVPQIRSLLEQDFRHLEDIQSKLSAARKFYLVVRLRGQQERDVFRYLSTVEQSIKSCGFTVQRCGKEDIKRMLSVYYQQFVPEETMDDYDGQHWVAPEPKVTKKRGKRNKRDRPVEAEKDFLDLVSPSILRFYGDHYICGNTYRSVWAIRDYPTRTEEQALLRHLGEKNGVTLRIYCCRLSQMDTNAVFDNAVNKNRMNSFNSNNMQSTVTAGNNLEDLALVIDRMQKNSEPLVRCAVYIELISQSYDGLKQLQTDVQAELARGKINIDHIILRQQQGFCCVNPAGYNALGSTFERVLPASSVANLFPFNYSGKTDRNGFYIGKDRFGTNVLVDFDQRDDDKTSANILILGNSGQGKSHLMKHLIINILESGKSIISLDPEHEQKDLCKAMGGYFIDLMSGEYKINVLEPKIWSDSDDAIEQLDLTAPAPFRKRSALAQHISFLKDFFRAYKNFSDAQIDTIEILLARLYAEWGISEDTNFRNLPPEKVPILSDLYSLMQREMDEYNGTQLYTKQLLQEVSLGLNSMCVGSDAQFFNGPTNIDSQRFLVFGVGGLMTAATNVRNAMLFNILSFMSNKLLVEGNTVAALDELHIWLDNPVALEYIRNCLKRVRKRNSAMLMASQNLEDFDLPNIREMTKPLFSIPPHQFLFNPGSISKQSYMDMLQLEEAEFNLIKYPHRGTCLYKCGNDRYLLDVMTPDYKRKLFGEAGGQ